MNTRGSSLLSFPVLVSHLPDVLAQTSEASDMSRPLCLPMRGAYRMTTSSQQAVCAQPQRHHSHCHLGIVQRGSPDPVMTHGNLTLGYTVGRWLRSPWAPDIQCLTAVHQGCSNISSKEHKLRTG